MNGRSRIMFTKEGPAKEDDSYMGYSIATGDFVGNGDSGTAVGVPRGSDLLGKVCGRVSYYTLKSEDDTKYKSMAMKM